MSVKKNFYKQIFIGIWMVFLQVYGCYFYKCMDGIFIDIWMYFYRYMDDIFIGIWMVFL